jgi:F420H(2)-dependent quinone reductase
LVLQAAGVPAAEVQIGDETYSVVARVADADERAPIWRKPKRAFPQFAGHEEKTTRKIPVVILELTG